MGKIDKTYEKALNDYEMHVDIMPSKKQKKQKTKMRQNGKKIIEKELKEWPKKEKNGT